MLLVFALSFESKTCNRTGGKKVYHVQTLWPVEINAIINSLKNTTKHRTEVPGEVPDLIIYT